jgi:hypothetical protein
METLAWIILPVVAGIMLFALLTGIQERRRQTE